MPQIPSFFRAARTDSRLHCSSGRLHEDFQQRRIQSLRTDRATVQELVHEPPCEPTTVLVSSGPQLSIRLGTSSGVPRTVRYCTSGHLAPSEPSTEWQTQLPHC